MKTALIKFRNFSIFSILFTFIFNIQYIAAINNTCSGNVRDIINNLCEQNARQMALESNLALIGSLHLQNKTPNAIEPNIDKLLFKTNYTIVEKTLAEDIKVVKVFNKFDNWPRPKILRRNFEVAVNSLDLNGKKDLKSCTKLNRDKISNKSALWNTQELDAVLHFSEKKLSNINLSNYKTNSKHTLKDCEQLLSLILGKI